MWFVYILLCEDQSLYTGISKNVNKRFLDHQKGIGSKYTRSHKPIKIVFTQEFSTKSEALKREAEIKNWDRKNKIRLLNLNAF